MNLPPDYPAPKPTATEHHCVTCGYPTRVNEDKDDGSLECENPFCATRLENP